MFQGVCPLVGNYVIGSEQDCAFITSVRGVQCSARSYVAATSSCHCHMSCPVASMLLTQQQGVRLMLGLARNFCPSGRFPIDVSSADTSLANCANSQSGARRLLQADLPPADLPPARWLLQAAALDSFRAAMYVPTVSELAALGLEEVLYGSNALHTDNWQRLFVLVSLEARRSAASMVGCEFRVRLAALSPEHGELPRSVHSRLFELGCVVRLG